MRRARAGLLQYSLHHLSLPARRAGPGSPGPSARPGALTALDVRADLSGFRARPDRLAALRHLQLVAQVVHDERPALRQVSDQGPAAPIGEVFVRRGELVDLEVRAGRNTEIPK